MPYDESLAERTRKLLARRNNVEEKKMFGGVGYLLGGNMCVGVWKEFLIVRLGAEQAEAALRTPHVRVFDITGKAMKGWVMVAPAGVADDETLKEWVQRAVSVVSRLPAK